MEEMICVYTSMIVSVTSMEESGMYTSMGSSEGDRTSAGGVAWRALDGQGARHGRNAQGQRPRKAGRSLLLLLLRAQTWGTGSRNLTAAPVLVDIDGDILVGFEGLLHMVSCETSSSIVVGRGRNRQAGVTYLCACGVRGMFTQQRGLF